MAEFAARPALVSHAGEVTYAQLGEAVTQLSSAFRRLCLLPGDRVVCQLSNRPELLVAAMAAWECSATYVAFDADLTMAESSRLLTLLRPGIVIHSDQGAYDRLINGIRGSPKPKAVLCGEEALAFTSPVESSLNGTPEQTWIGGPCPHDPATILLTSGTSGAAKAVVRRHGELLGTWRAVAANMHFTEDDVHLAQLPLSHGFGFGLAVEALLTGGRLILVDHFSPDHALERIRTERVTVLNGTPAHFRLIVDGYVAGRHDVSSLRIGCGSAAQFPPDLIADISNKLGMNFVLSYGSSEGLGITTRDREVMLRGSVGKARLDLVRILAPDHTPLPTGVAGEVVLWQRHPVWYWDGAGRSPRRDPGGWHHTGDLGQIDTDGFLHILGRLDRRVNRGGIGVDPGELEAYLAANPKLADAAVIAFPDPVLGLAVCACVVPAGGADISLEELREFLAPDLARHKMPERLCVLRAIPRTQGGDVEHSILADLVARAIGAGRSMTPVGRSETLTHDTIAQGSDGTSATVVRWRRERDDFACAALSRDSWLDSWPHLGEGADWPALWEGRLTLEASWSGPRAAPFGTLVADVNGLLVGFAKLVLLHNGDSELAELYILPRWRRRGVGSALWDASVAALRSRGCERVQVWTQAASAANAFYQRVGCFRFDEGTFRLGSKVERVLGYALDLRK
jgi:acyl-CoA synthetase (AMP-forming)/AMP-acid ligase II/GNAT superfamily N-acetyltransferase